MAILSASFAALGAFAPEANPSLQGQDLYTKAAKGDKTALAVMDKVGIDLAIIRDYEDLTA